MSSFRKPTMVMSFGVLGLTVLGLSSYASASSDAIEHNAKDVCEAFFASSMNHLHGNATYILNFQNIQSNYINLGECGFDEVNRNFDPSSDSDSILNALVLSVLQLLDSLKMPLAYAANEIYSAYIKNLFRNLIFGLSDYSAVIFGAVGLKWLAQAAFWPGQQMIELRKWLFTKSDTPVVKAETPIPESLLVALANKMAELDGATVFSSRDSVVIQSKELAQWYQEYQQRALEQLQKNQIGSAIEISKDTRLICNTR